MTFDGVDDERLHQRFAAVAPTEVQVARMQVSVMNGYAQRPVSLWREWLGLLQARPLVNGSLVAVAAMVLIFATPLGALLRALSSLPQLQAVVSVRGDAATTKQWASRNGQNARAPASYD